MIREMFMKSMEQQFYLMEDLKDAHKHINDKDYHYWWAISHTKNLSIEFVREYKDYLSWNLLCYNYSIFIDDDFCREFVDYIDWDTLCKQRTWLGDKILLEFRDYLNWKIVSKTQSMSYDFIKEHINLFDFKGLKQNLNINETTKERLGLKHEYQACY